MNKTKIRPSHHDSKEISFLWTPGEKLVELVQMPMEGLNFAIRESGSVAYSKTYGEFKPISWLEQYLNVGAFVLPSEATPNVDLDDLAAGVRGFIHRYFDCDPVFEAMATLYVLHTWMYEQFQAVPYLRFLGLPGSGKTRGTEVIGALCYRPLVMAGSTTPAPMFRMIEVIGGTMLIDEADFAQSQVGSDIVKVLNCGYQRNLPVTRTEKNNLGEFVPRVYEVFGPKIINGRRLFKDEATESRCLPYTPQVTSRSDIPVQLTGVFSAEANKIQNMALGWRMANLDTFKVIEKPIAGLKGRSHQIVIPLLSVACAMSRSQCEKYRADLVAFCQNLDTQAQVDRLETVEGQLVAAFVKCEKDQLPTCKDLSDLLRNSGENRWLTPNKASRLLRSMGFETRHTNRGSEVTIKVPQLESLCKRFGLTVPQVGGDGGDDGELVERIQPRSLQKTEASM
jgi:hypothetical protein